MIYNFISRTYTEPILNTKEKSMPEFVVSRYITPLTVNAESIFSVVRDEETSTTLLRGWKIAKRYTIVEDVFTEQKHIKCAVEVLNSKGAVKEKFFIVSRTPATTEQVRSVYNNEVIKCRDCGGDQFYYLGRSLFSYSYECAGCSKQISPCTESGASQ